MSEDVNGTSYYAGAGEKTDNRTWRDVPDVDPGFRDPANYRCPAGLAAAVNVALNLGLPLLLTGEPGCGKSRLADSIAWELDILDPDTDAGEAPKPRALRYSIKSDTDSRDLFYRFDTLGRFHAAQTRNGSVQPTADTAVVQDSKAQAPSSDIDPRRYVTFNALGKAVLYAHGREGIASRYPGLLLEQQLQRLPETPQRSVVLIDEIDKAPREVPNDLLNEIDELSFDIPELFGYFDRKVSLPLSDPKAERPRQINRPIIIITSNGERELPEAFLRRCVYYHVELPPFSAESGVSIEGIVAAQLGKHYGDKTPLRQDCLHFFAYVRQPQNSVLKGKRPSMAELLHWMLFLSLSGADGAMRLKNHPDFTASLSILLKHENDVQPGTIKQLIDNWLPPT